MAAVFGKSFGPALRIRSIASRAAPFGAGTSADFHDSRREYIAVAHDAAFEVAEGTIQLWFNTRDAYDRQTLFAKDQNGTSNGLRIYLDDRDLKVRLEGGGSVRSIDTDGTSHNNPVRSNTWYQLTFTFGAGGRATWRQHTQSAGSAAVAYAVTGGAMFVLHQLVAAPGAVLEQAVYLSASALTGVARFAVLRLVVFARAHPAGWNRRSRAGAMPQRPSVRVCEERKAVAHAHTSCATGLAATADLQTTVMPGIIRGVSLLGVASAGTARGIRDAVWARLAGDWKPAHLDRICTREATLAELPGVFARMLDGGSLGRTVVRV